MKRLIYIMLLAAAKIALRADPLGYVGSDETDHDARAVAELRFVVEADALPKEQKGVLFFVPVEVATEREKQMVRAFAQGMMIESEDPFRSWGYSLALWPRAGKVDVVVSVERTEGKTREIQREACFQIAEFEDVCVKKAGIRLTLTWVKRPNQALLPTSTAVTPAASHLSRQP
jgi:hypothetical protein